MELFWLLSSAFVFVSLSNALDCTLPSNTVVNQLLRDEVTSAGGEGSSVSIRGGPYYTCQVQGTTNGTYQELSVIMEYNTSGGNDRVGQFEIICQISPDGWGRRVESLTVLSAGPGVTYDSSIGLRTNCSSCINTAGNDNHCIGCHPSCNIGLMRCTDSNEDDCCIVFDNDGVCQSDYTFWCNGNPCNNGGTCTGTQEGYNCTCVNGYTGMNCDDHSIDYCEDNPCQNNGTCNNEMDGYNCTCIDGLTDKNCSANIDDCAIDPCINNGTCVDEIADYTCVCVDGFTDKNCETDINECEDKPCLNGATCIDLVNSYICVCTVGFTGNDCNTEINYCSNNDSCLNGGTCVSLADGFMCVCPYEYTGDNCGSYIDACDSTPCMNEATCTSSGGPDEYTCTCVDGYTGQDCSTNINDCASDPCINNGTCVDEIASYTCICVDGFTDKNCSTNIDDCAGDPCINNGTCVDEITDYTCICVDGFTGSDCGTDINECEQDNPCQNGGSCINTFPLYSCICDENYTGTNCESSLPLSQTCLSRCSDPISFEQNLCIFYCQLKGWREIAVASGLQLPPVEEYTSEGITSSVQWVHAVAEQEKFHNLWLNEMLRQNLPTIPATHENDDQQDDRNLAWLEQVSNHQSYSQSWRDDYKTFVEQNTEFRELLTNITAIRDDTSQDELSQVYEDYNEVWADDLNNYLENTKQD